MCRKKEEQRTAKTSTGACLSRSGIEKGYERGIVIGKRVGTRANAEVPVPKATEEQGKNNGRTMTFKSPRGSHVVRAKRMDVDTIKPKWLKRGSHVFPRFLGNVVKLI